MRFYTVILLILIQSNFLFLQANEAVAPSIFDIMSHQEVVDITIEANLSSLQNDRHSEESQKAILSFGDAAGNIQQWNIKVSLRGKFRRLRCTDMPPLKLKFKKDDLANAGLADFNDMKLVTHCVEDKPEAKATLLREYLTYKLYNELTEESYRVQLVAITYVDTATNSKTKRYAFLIEDTAQMRDRIGAAKCSDCNVLMADQYDQEALQRVSLFEYMIGNADWNYHAVKNMKVVRVGEKFLPVPYDFDFSGMVDAPYAIPNSDYQLWRVQDRVYLGPEELLVDQDAMIDLFKEKRSDLERVIRSFKTLRLSDRHEMLNYLDSFYTDLPNINTPATYLEPVEEMAEEK